MTTQQNTAVQPRYVEDIYYTGPRHTNDQYFNSPMLSIQAAQKPAYLHHLNEQT